MAGASVPNLKFVDWIAGRFPRFFSRSAFCMFDACETHGSLRRGGKDRINRINRIYRIEERRAEIFKTREPVMKDPRS
jgi:hypothetical protein